MIILQKNLSRRDNILVEIRIQNITTSRQGRNIFYMQIIKSRMKEQFRNNNLSQKYIFNY